MWNIVSSGPNLETEEDVREYLDWLNRVAKKANAKMRLKRQEKKREKLKKASNSINLKTKKKINKYLKKISVLVNGE